MRRFAAPALAALLLLTGTLHLVRPGIFEGIVPGFLGSPRAWVLVSGVAELTCAVGLLVPRTRAVAGWACVALFVAVFPANVQMAVDAVQGGRGVEIAVALVRLPLQLPLILWAAYVSRAGSRAAPARRRSRAAA